MMPQVRLLMGRLLSRLEIFGRFIGWSISRSFIMSLKGRVVTILRFVKALLYLDYCTGCSEKIVFFHNSLQPRPRQESFKALNAM